MVVRRTITYWNPKAHMRLTRQEPAMLDYAWVAATALGVLEAQLRAAALPPVTLVRTQLGEPLLASPDLVDRLLWLAEDGVWDEDTTVRPDELRPQMQVEVQLSGHGVIRGIVLSAGRNRVRIDSPAFPAPIKVSPSSVLRVIN